MTQEPIGATLTIAIAMASGVVAQSLARHVRLPGIVLLLGMGVLLGPDALGLVDPVSLGPALQALVGFAVAVILFEGGMNLNVARLRREAGVIRRLITWGALVTALGGALSARLIMGWDWRLSILFGTLVIVTGPTVITPLLRRIRVKHSVETVLEAEGVLIDAIGAIVAVVALEVAISPSGRSLAEGVLDVLLRLGSGVLFGAVGGLALAGLLRTRVIPDGLENVFTLSAVLVLFQASDHLLPESGIAAVTAAGLVVGNVKTRVHKELMEFKEQLTVLLIGVLFVLLAADVRVAGVTSLGWPGVATVIALMLVVRPLNVLAGTIGTSISVRERIFLSWIAPRGIVAAAIASLFAQSLDGHDIAGGDALRALVFLVIAVTVVLQGLTGGLVAQALGLRRVSQNGYAIFGANMLALKLGEILRQAGQEVVFMDSNADRCHAAERAGFRVIFGNALRERELLQARIDSRAGAIALTANEEINLLFAKKVREEASVLQLYVALHRDHPSIKPEMVREIGGLLLFGAPKYLSLWSVRLERNLAASESWRWHGGSAGRRAAAGEAGAELGQDEKFVIALVHRRGRRVSPVNDALRLREGDVVDFLVYTERRDEARVWLIDQGWKPVEPPGPGSGPSGG